MVKPRTFRLTQSAPSRPDPEDLRTVVRATSAILGEGGLRDPLKGMGREDTALPEQVQYRAGERLTARALLASAVRRRRLQIRSLGRDDGLDP